MAKQPTDPALLSAIALALKKSIDSLRPDDVRQLRELDLRDTEFTYLSPLSGLAALESLWLSATQVTDLSPL